MVNDVGGIVKDATGGEYDHGEGEPKAEADEAGENDGDDNDAEGDQTSDFQNAAEE